MPNPDPEHLLAIIESLRDDMNSRLDQLAAAVRETASPAAPASRHKRRIPYPSAIVPTDLDRAKAKAALRRMGIKP